MKKIEDYTELKILGISINESKCYLALLELGSSSANEVSRKSGVHRVAVYDALRGLREKGLVSQVLKSNKLLFESASPEKLQDMIQERRSALEETEKLLPELMLKFEAPKEKQEVHSFKGIAGLKTVFQGMLASKTEVLDFGAEWHIRKVLSHYYAVWDNERVQKKIRMRIIANLKIKNRETKKLRLTQLHYIPKEFTSRVSTYIYENKVALVMWVETPLAILIEHSVVAESYRNYFECLWKLSVK